MCKAREQEREKEKIKRKKERGKILKEERDR